MREILILEWSGDDIAVSALTINKHDMVFGKT
jgi:hypothetical protein